MPTLTIRERLFAHVDKMTAQVAGFRDGMAVIGDRFIDELINIAGDNSWQAQSLARQIAHIQVQLRGQLNQSGYSELAAKFVNNYDESELFARQILQELGKLSGQLVPMRPDTVKNLKAFDLTRFDEQGNGIIRSLSRELVLNTVGGKKRSDVIKSLTDEMDGQVEQATNFADTALRSYDRFVNTEMFVGAGITHFRYFGPKDVSNRPFCREHVGKVYSLDEIKKMSNGSTRFGNVLVYGGGARCRHTWTPVVDPQDAEESATPAPPPAPEPPAQPTPGRPRPTRQTRPGAKQILVNNQATR